MRLLHKLDARSDGVMGKTGIKTKQNDQRECHSHSLFGSLKEFGSHLSKAIGLNDLHHGHHDSHSREDEVLFASFEPHTEMSRQHGPRRGHQRNGWDPWKGSGTYCQPGPSTPWIPRKMQAAPTVANLKMPGLSNTNSQKYMNGGWKR